jgi:hypothetical protein
MLFAFGGPGNEMMKIDVDQERRQKLITGLRWGAGDREPVNLSSAAPSLRPLRIGCTLSMGLSSWGPSTCEQTG